jgi:hypothetical protein
MQLDTPEQKACIFGCALFVLGASHEVLVCKRAQSMLARTRCALTPQTQNLRRSSQRFPCNIGLTAWHA